jgi:histidyl-tRNA synthetase
MIDLLPGDMAAFRRIAGMCRESCLKWGYREVRTPTLEYLHLFTSAGTLTPDMLGKVYSFLDWDGWSGERVVLRPDGTIPIARLYAENMGARELARLFYVANIFIFDEAEGVNRERWQCGAELIGSAAAAADVELVALTMEIINKLGITGVELRLSHAGMIKALLGQLGLSNGERHRLFEEVLEGNPEAVSEVAGGNPEYRELLTSLLGSGGQSPDFIRAQQGVLREKMPDIAADLDDFLKVIEMLEALGYPCQVDIASGAGFEYYTGMIFQLYAGGEKIGGGGRYDDLIASMGGGDVPAGGFAVYLERILGLAKPELASSPEAEKVLVRSGETTVKAAFQLCDRLRRAGYIAEADLGRQSPEGYRWVIGVSPGTPAFKVQSASGATGVELAASGDVIKYLEENRGGKAGTA